MKTNYAGPMTDLMKKLNWKGHSPVALLHSPLSFAGECAALAAETTVHVELHPGAKYPFAVTFAVDGSVAAIGDMRPVGSVTGSKVQGTIGKDAKNLEQLRKPLDLVDDHESTEWFECAHGSGQPGEIGRVFQIENRYPWPLGESASKGGLPDLARPENGNDRAVRKGPSYMGRIDGAINHGVSIP